MAQPITTTSDALISRGGERLTAVLLNPPSATTGVRTRNAVDRAALTLGYAEVLVVNLCLHPTRSVLELNDYFGDGWAAAREDLSWALSRSSGWLAAWGVGGLTGHARKAKADQIAWLTQESRNLRHKTVWMVGAEPRHPSRWHQYLSDKYGRTAGGSPSARLAEALVQVDLP